MAQGSQPVGKPVGAAAAVDLVVAGAEQRFGVEEKQSGCISHSAGVGALPVLTVSYPSKPLLYVVQNPNILLSRSCTANVVTVVYTWQYIARIPSTIVQSLQRNES